MHIKITMLFLFEYMTITKENLYKILTIILSIVLPLAVTVIYLMPKLSVSIFNFHILPLINAWINGFTFVVLLAALIAIKQKKISLHKRLMTSALVLSILFLVLYVTYHTITESTKFQGEGLIKTIYFFILFTHIICAVSIVPLVLITYIRAISEKFDKHKKIAKITFPIWLYVSISGVIVYLLISPYYT